MIKFTVIIVNCVENNLQYVYMFILRFTIGATPYIHHSTPVTSDIIVCVYIYIHIYII